MKATFVQFVKYLLLAALIAAALEIGSRAIAFPLFVYNTNDSGPSSLRQAVADNNAFGGSNTITFAVTGVIPLTSGELLVTNDLNIIGPGDKALVVQGNGAARIFNVGNAAVNISGLTIANGSNSFGGGILLRSGSLTLTRCTVTKNSALNGGGIAQTNGTLLITDSTISSNKASSAGVGLYVQGPTTTTIRGSTFAGNYGTGSSTPGGGIRQGGQSLTLENCTFCDNGGLGDGGGALNVSGNTTITSCTFSGNHAWAGGGISSEGGTVLLRNTILAGNTSLNTGIVASPDCYGPMVSAGYNLVGNRTNSTGWGAQGDQFGSTASPINPKLAPLRDNGGPTWTMSLSNNSPAIDKGDSSNLTVDQRGSPRPLDKPQFANANGGDGADIGAYEAGLRTLTVSNLNNSGTGSLQQALNDAAVEDITTIQFAPDLTGTIFPPNGFDLAKNLVINGPGAARLALSGNFFSHVLNSSGNVTISITGLTIKDGNVIGEDAETEQNGENVQGAGIRNSANLTLTECVITNNLVKGGAGGSTSGGTAGNGGDAWGAGIVNSGTLTLTRCIVAGNKAIAGAAGMAFGGTTGQSGGALGGGIYSAGPVTFNNCALYDNQVSGGPKNIGGPSAAGAAIFSSGQGLLSIFNCTITGNQAPGGDGVVYDNGTGSLVRNSTIVSNQATGLYFSGGNVGNTIIAYNGDYFDVLGSMSSADFNLIGTTNGSTITGYIEHTIFSQDPRLGPLRNNGGATPTMALLPGSPAIDRGASFGWLIDQRGSPRVYDFPAIANGTDGTDIGAYELNPPVLNLRPFGTNAYVSWTTNEPSFVLESSTNLALPSAWVTVPGIPFVSGTELTVKDGLVPTKFYRLRSK